MEINCINSKKKTFMAQNSHEFGRKPSLTLPNDISSSMELSVILVVTEFKELIYFILYYSDLWSFLVIHE